ncbi:hypothetical protein L8P27_05115 [Enterobacter asburiae]|uniref:hypothetical protein n=1 Tax=Enterobacter asburiae TaxID=61645 RepID=UPI002002E2AA|nr:hypothetical protein [Enterobacter asburiae]MCK7227232.1 hypothetical protein [Enterobacter asburiae]
MTAVNTLSTIQSPSEVPASSKAHRAAFEGLQELCKSYQELQVITQENSIFDAQNSWKFGLDSYNHKKQAAAEGLKASKFKAGFSMAGGLLSLGLSGFSSFASKGITPKARKEHFEIKRAAEQIEDPHARALFKQENDKKLNRHRTLQAFGQNSMPINGLFNGFGEAASGAHTANAGRYTSAAELDNTQKEIAKNDQQAQQREAEQVMQQYSALMQVAAKAFERCKEATSRL